MPGSVAAAMPELDYDSSNLTFALSCAADVAMLLAALAWALRGERVGRRLVLAVALLGAVLGAKGVLMVASGLQVPFGVLHVLWLDLVIAIPVGGACLLVGAGRRSRALRVIAPAAILLAPVGLYASCIEPGRLVTERASLTLSRERAGSTPLRIAVLADLQFERVGGHERRAVELAMRERPDVILLAGDIHQGEREVFDHELPAIKRVLGELRAPGGVYAVQGDVETIAEARLVTAGTAVRMLVNRSVRVRVRDRRLTIAGVELFYRSDAARATAGGLERAQDDGEVRILLAHRPDVALDLAPQTRVDLTVAGHTHGGQLQLPLIGPPMIASRVPRDVGAGGLHELGGRSLYVSRGIGVERNQAPKLRLGAPPEVSLITLR